MELDHYLNLTMAQVCEHQGVLYELDSRLLINNRTLILAMTALSHVQYMLTILTDVHTAVTQITSVILSLKEGADSLYEDMHCLASHEVNPLTVLLLTLDKMYVM